MTTEIDWEQTLFTLILHAGNARSKAKEAAELAETGDWEGAQRCLAEANTEQEQAHAINAGLIRREAGGEALIAMTVDSALPGGDGDDIAAEIGATDARALDLAEDQPGR